MRKLFLVLLLTTFATGASATCRVPNIVGAFEAQFDATPNSNVRFTVLVHAPDRACGRRGNYSVAQPNDDRGDSKGRYIRRQGCYDMRDEHLLRSGNGAFLIEVHEFTACHVSGSGGDEFSIDAVFVTRLDLNRDIAVGPDDFGPATLLRLPSP